MTFFTYFYDTKLDAKGRLVLPSKLKAQLPPGEDQEIVIKLGYEPCLTLYPIGEFKKVFSRISALPEFIEENRTLQRSYMFDSMGIPFDAAGRLLIPKSMLAYASIEKDVRLVGVGTKLELWNPQILQQHKLEPGRVGELTEKVMKKE